MAEIKAKGRVVKAFGNLLHIYFDGNIRQGEISYVKLADLLLAAEVLEINGNVAKVQVFEDTRGVKLNMDVEFTGDLLEAELGPGLLTSIFDGLQNPLEKIKEQAGLYLTRGLYIAPLDRKKLWDFHPIVKVKDTVRRGDFLGEVTEGRFRHKIMVPFMLRGEYTITEVIKEGDYNIDTVVAKAVDNSGKVYEFKMVQKWPVKFPLKEGNQIKPADTMSTGLRIIDTMLPLVKGGTFCSPGPFGAGKTVLQHHLAKFSAVDIVVIAACGERAGEVVEVLREFPHLIDTKTSAPLMERTVIICNTSSMPVAAREASVYMGVTIGEYYRQMGLDVLLLADSTSRWAQAMREMSGRLEEIPGEEAFPAYLASRIFAFYERAGVIETKEKIKGSLTIGGAVSPAGGNFEEPVTQSTLAVAGCFLGLSRARSNARRYPAIDPLISWSKYIDIVGEQMDAKLTKWKDKVRYSLKLLREGDQIEKRMEVVGEEGITLNDILTYLKSQLYEICYLQQNAFDKEDEYFSIERQIELFDLVQTIFDKSFSFETHDDARSYFLSLQNEIKNMNFLPFKSEKYNRTISEIRKKITDEKL
jgi:V/A-type H+-transporting ATPase subunit A